MERKRGRKYVKSNFDIVLPRLGASDIGKRERRSAGEDPRGRNDRRSGKLLPRPKMKISLTKTTILNEN